MNSVIPQVWACSYEDWGLWRRSCRRPWSWRMALARTWKAAWITEFSCRRWRSLTTQLHQVTPERSLPMEILLWLDRKDERRWLHQSTCIGRGERTNKLCLVRLLVEVNLLGTLPFVLRPVGAVCPGVAAEDVDALSVGIARAETGDLWKKPTRLRNRSLKVAPHQLCCSDGSLTIHLVCRAREVS